MSKVSLRKNLAPGPYLLVGDCLVAWFVVGKKMGKSRVFNWRLSANLTHLFQWVSVEMFKVGTTSKRYYIYRYPMKNAGWKTIFLLKWAPLKRWHALTMLIFRDVMYLKIKSKSWFMRICSLNLLNIFFQKKRGKQPNNLPCWLKVTNKPYKSIYQLDIQAASTDIPSLVNGWWFRNPPA